MSPLPRAEINRQNAQSSTGPKTEAGKQRSSLNATRHGFTGQTLFLLPEEKEAYEAHCLAYRERYAPATHEESDLIQQYADLRWSLHQLCVEQSNVLAVLNVITTNLLKDGALEALPAATAPYHKTLNTLSTYEQRRRRAAEATLARFTELSTARIEAAKSDLAKAVTFYNANKAQGKSWSPADSGFVCSLADIESHLKQKAIADDVRKFYSDRSQEPAR
jgi:hypothetical protein